MINPNEAPEGFVAIVPRLGCEGCAFLDHDDNCTLTNFSCYPSERTDGEDVIFLPREKSNLAESSELQKANEEAARWKSSHDHVCRELTACENARDENARLCDEARDESSRWKAECRDLTSLVANLKAQLTTALESIARMR